MRIIVGLGNPGRKYDWTPHNLGFHVVDLLAERWNVRVTRPEAQSLMGLGHVTSEDVILAKPQTYMNSSGHAIADLLERNGADSTALILVSDEIALPWGMIRIRERGSAGGHNGLKSVIAALGTDEFLRVRLGIKPKFSVPDLAVYDLAPMGREVRKAAEEMIASAADAVEAILTDGASRAMSKFNRKATPDEEAAESAS
ncbi:MAG TPA: aminoacyl-tRNA hydrolase [Candidatus Acidoferrales bacterium]|nr:aminoacyl-tRNA hydrolase [Candidatus Acidoferrales bacterium]